jgi:hypothetical protein
VLSESSTGVGGASRLGAMTSEGRRTHWPAPGWPPSESNPPLPLGETHSLSVTHGQFKLGTIGRHARLLTLANVSGTILSATTSFLPEPCRVRSVLPYWVCHGACILSIPSPAHPSPSRHLRPPSPYGQPDTGSVGHSGSEHPPRGHWQVQVSRSSANICVLVYVLP